MAKTNQQVAGASVGSIEVRRLTTFDVFRVARIINKCSRETKQEIFNAVVTESGNPAIGENGHDQESPAGDMTLEFNPTKLFFAVAAMLDEAEDPMIKFLASLGNMKEQDLKNAPPETAIEILVAVFHQEQEHLSGFFEQVAGLASETSGGSST